MNNKTKIKSWSAYAIAYIMWIVSFLLWVWFMFNSRNALISTLTAYYYQDNFQRGKQIAFINQAWLVVLGIVWLVLMVTVENYFRKGVKKGDLARRVGRIVGPEVLLILATDIDLAFLVGLGHLPALNWLIIFTELVLGIGLIWLARNGPKGSGQDKSYKVG